MNEMIYRLADYASLDDRRQILNLYQAIFHISFAYDEWFCEQRDPLGVVATDSSSGEISGHFATLRFAAKVAGKAVPFRMSMGLMVSPERRGAGIALRLYERLRRAVLEKGDAAFIMGFPNDVSYKMHVERMDYELYRNYHFVTFPKGAGKGNYVLEEDISQETFQEVQANHLERSGEYMTWRYADKKYDKWRAENGHIFISTRFMDKADILYWSGDAGGGELLDFAAFLYAAQGVKRVTTWNTEAFLDALPREKRDYHMCVNYLDCGPVQREEIQRDWFFYMGDCELF